MSEGTYFKCGEVKEHFSGAGVIPRGILWLRGVTVCRREQRGGSQVDCGGTEGLKPKEHRVTLAKGWASWAGSSLRLLLRTRCLRSSGPGVCC